MSNRITSSANPLVSIVMSARNAEDTITLALRSILQQSYSHWELIVVDDGSVDLTLERLQSVKDSRIRVVADGMSQGLARRLNETVRMAKGKYIARMDADDISCEDRLARQVAYLEKNPEVDLVGTGAVVFRGNGEVVGSFPIRELHDEICAAPWSGFLLAHPTWMGKRTWFLRFGYCESARRAQDQDLLLRAYQTSRYACIPELLLGYRQDIPAIRNVVLGRYYYAVALWRYARETNRFRFAVKGVATQFLRGVIAVTLVALGLGRRLLARRFRLVDRQGADAWQHCWFTVNGGKQP